MLIPYGKMIIAKRLGDPSKSAGGAVRSASLEESSVRVKVIASAISDIKEDEILIVRKYSGNEYEYNGEKVLFINHEDVVAKEPSND